MYHTSTFVYYNIIKWLTAFLNWVKNSLLSEQSSYHCFWHWNYKTVLNLSMIFLLKQVGKFAFIKLVQTKIFNFYKKLFQCLTIIEEKQKKKLTK